jgi:hypothetical protein
MSSTIKIKRSAVAGKVPSSLDVGEIAVNLFDRKLYVGNTTGVTAISGEDFRLTTMDSGSEGAYLRLSGDSVLSTNNVLLSAGEGIDISRLANGTISFAGEDATASNKGIASFDSGEFSVTSGAVSLADSASGAVLAINGTTDEVEVSRTNGTVTVGLPDDVLITNNLDVGGDLSVSGDLTVSGGLTYLSTSTVYTDDGMFKLSANNAGDVTDTGIYGMYIDGVTTKYAGYFRDATDGVFKFYTGSETEPTTTVDTSSTGYTLAQIDAIIDGGTY